MTKADIVEQIRSNTGLPKQESYQLLESVFSIMKSTLESGEKIKITGFGNFEVKGKNDRKGRNPQTGEDIVITARKVLTFKPSPILKQDVNR